MILIGDIGGTNTRLALAERRDDGLMLHAVEHFSTPLDLRPLLAGYLASQSAGPIEAVALCGAGPVMADGRIALSNHDCLLDPAEIRTATGIGLVLLLNDFEAVAHAVPALDARDLRAIGSAPANPGFPLLVLGAGTGLGLASLVPNGEDWIVCPGEGGHADLAPVDDDEVAIFLKLRKAHGALSIESLLSGSGFARLHAALTDGPALEPRAIVDAARQGDAPALLTMKMFSRWLGRAAGNAALTLGARSGVYIGGGIVPSWGVLFDDVAFRSGFTAKAGFEDWLATIPVQVIMHPQPGLLGLARYCHAALRPSA